MVISHSQKQYFALRRRCQMNCIDSRIVISYMPPMDIQDAVTRIDRWLKATKMAESRLGMLSSANPHAISRIRAGTARIDTLQAVLDYIEKNPSRK
jgi:hypothetical protein